MPWMPRSASGTNLPWACGLVGRRRRHPCRRYQRVPGQCRACAAGFVATRKGFRVTPHIARNVSGRRSNVPDAVAGSDGYATSQKLRKRIEEVFGWVKTIDRQDKTPTRGLARVGWQFTLASAAYNLFRIPKLPAVPA